MILTAAKNVEERWYVTFWNMHGHDCAFVEIDLEAGCLCKLIEEEFESAGILHCCLEDNQCIVRVLDDRAWQFMVCWVANIPISFDKPLQYVCDQ